MVDHEKQVSQLGQLLAAVEGSDGTAIEAPLTHKVRGASSTLLSLEVALSPYWNPSRLVSQY